jgi:ribonuclease HII
VVRPSLTLERRLLRAGADSVVGIDEVGRGSLAGPVTVGAALITARTRSAPKGLRDSKLLTAGQREGLVGGLRRWASASAVGHAAPEEIDVLGLTAALRLAAVRALVRLDRPIAAIVLDGAHDWLASTSAGLPEFPGSHQVTMQVKADQRCSAVAAASVLAKVARDRLMVERSGAEDRYHWCSNKGYAAPEHIAALDAHGPTELHRLSWQLPGVDLAALDRIDPARRRTWRRFADGEQLVMLEAHDQPAAVESG